jgi:hypothetical protein
VAVGGEHLNANVVGAGRVMLANTVSDCIEITPSDHRVDQPVTAAIPEIVFVESKPEKVVSVVRQLEVELQELASDFSRFRRSASRPAASPNQIAPYPSSSNSLAASRTFPAG